MKWTGHSDRTCGKNRLLSLLLTMSLRISTFPVENDNKCVSKPLYGHKGWSSVIPHDLYGVLSYLPCWWQLAKQAPDALELGPAPSVRVSHGTWTLSHYWSYCSGSSIVLHKVIPCFFSNLCSRMWGFTLELPLSFEMTALPSILTKRKDACHLDPASHGHIPWTGREEFWAQFRVTYLGSVTVKASACVGTSVGICEAHGLGWVTQWAEEGWEPCRGYGGIERRKEISRQFGSHISLFHTILSLSIFWLL